MSQPTHVDNPFGTIPATSLNEASDSDLRFLSTEKIDRIVAAHQKMVKELRALLDERDSSGTPTVRAHLAARGLIGMESPSVLPFLAHNISYRVPLPFAFTAQPILEACPYVLPLKRFERRGAEAVVDAVAKRHKDNISEMEWTLYGNVLVSVFRDDEAGRNAAIALIDRMDNTEEESLAVLRERVRTAKRVLYR